MRYESFMRALDQAREKYESTVRALIQDASKGDVSDSVAIRKLVKKTVEKKPKKKLHWTQRPENKTRMLRQLKKATKAKNGKA
jgi:hypothetical protein